MLSTSIMSSSTNTVSRLSQLEERQKRAQHLERRARAHEKLLLFAYSALSVPPPSIVVEKGEMSSISKQKLSMKSDSSSENSNKDKRNVQQPIEKEEKPKRANETISTIKPSVESKKSETFFDKKPQTAPIGTDKAKSVALQRQTLEQFCSFLRNEGLEVLKLNRDKKWQQRFLTFTKEITWLSNDQETFGPGDRGHCPQGILWLKKFNAKTKEHSVSNIGKQGKGGMFLSHLSHTSIVPSVSENYALSKKQKQGKFHDSIPVTLRSDFDGTSRTVIFRCLDMDAARLLCRGCNAIIEVLKMDAIAKDRAVKKIGLAQNRIVAAELGLTASQMRQINVSTVTDKTKSFLTEPPTPPLKRTPDGFWEL